VCSVVRLQDLGYIEKAEGFNFAAPSYTTDAAGKEGFEVIRVGLKNIDPFNLCKVLVNGENCEVFIYRNGGNQDI